MVIKANQDAATPILLAFDSDKNGTVSAQELENNPLLMLAVSPDLDLLDGSGNFNPGQDGAKTRTRWVWVLPASLPPLFCPETRIGSAGVSSNLASNHLLRRLR